MRRIGIALGSVVLAGSVLGVGLWLDARSRDADAPPKNLAAHAESVALERRDVGATEDLDAVVAEVEARVLDRPITMTVDGRPALTATLRELGATVDRARTVEHLAALRDEAGAHEASLELATPSEKLADRLVEVKELADHHPVGARRRIHRALGKDEITPHQDGSYLDAYAAMERAVAAARAPSADGKLDGPVSIELPAYRWVPLATRDAVAAIDVTNAVGTFETRFGGPPGRDRNIERGTSSLDGVVIMPGDTISFNELVGPRSEENGFFPAPEIYKGEMRLGIGGGSCQVASTLYASAFFGGLEVLERRNHSRPSGYIHIGLDATVSYPTLDLRIRNPFDFPVVVSAEIDKGKLRFEILGRARQVEVAFDTETQGILKYSRKLEKAGYLPPGEYRVKQKGRRGVSIKRKKTIRVLATGESRTEESTDIYPPTQEIFLISPGTKEADLPAIEPDPSAPKPADPPAAGATTPQASTDPAGTDRGAQPGG
ncbi:MAG: VanW family protein [Polyangiaceae bacterium]